MSKTEGEESLPDSEIYASMEQSPGGGDGSTRSALAGPALSAASDGANSQRTAMRHTALSH